MGIFDKGMNKARWGWFSITELLRFRIFKFDIGKNFKTNGIIYVKRRGGTLSLGDNVRINSSKTYNPIGCGFQTNIQLLPKGVLQIGNGVGMSNVSIACSRKIKIGDFVDLGDGVKIYDTDFHSLNPFIRNSSIDYLNAKKKTIYIGNYAFIGANTMILKGSEIGQFSIVGAGSVVAGIIPEKEVWGGNPARFIRKLTEEEYSQKAKKWNPDNF